MAKKTILITGAASGIGRQTALLFAEKGWYVGGFDIDEPGLESLQSEIEESGCFVGVMDVTDPASVQSGIEAFMARTGGQLNVLLNNAGILQIGLFENVPLEFQLKTVDVNLKGCVICTSHALPYLKETQDARVISISSIASTYGTPEYSVYSATKHGVSALTEALDIELEPYGIKVCDVKPPFVTTPMIAGADDVKSVKMLSFMGGQVSAMKIARTVWKAAHGNRLHWKVGFTKVLAFQKWLLPFTVRFSVKLLAMPKITAKP
ncbi:MAG TPA: SDR family oxidoreductase [Acidobacteria bacterium]|nr:SDR family oxidoreductase [Acidobacteriota bacterium]